MRSGMGNLLETDSDVASVSDSDRERTDGDGMESDGFSVNNKNGNAPVNNDSNNPTGLVNLKTGHVPPDVVGLPVAINCAPSLPSVDVKSKISDDGSAKPTCLRKGSTSNSDNISKTAVISPRELPPRSQLIQLKPTYSKAKDNNNKPAMVSVPLPDAVNKQKNPRFVPYEPYRGAVRPMTAQDESSKRHSRSTSDSSVTSIDPSLDQAMSSMSLTDKSQGLPNAQNIVKDNAHSQSFGDNNKSSKSLNRNTDSACNQIKKQEQIIQKQTHAISLLKERVKIAEKDNNDLHRENVKLKKLLVDSLSGDVLQGRMDLLTHDTTKPPCSANESVDILSNEIEVWRSKFLSSCVLVEQLTRENGTLNDAVGTAANIMKDIKLNSSLSPELFEEVNTWLRANRGTIAPTNNNISDVDS